MLGGVIAEYEKAEDEVQEYDYVYFLDNIEGLYQKYGHKYLVVKDSAIIGNYDSFDTALDDTLKSETLGTFLVQEYFKTKEQCINHFQGNIQVVPLGKA